MQHKMMEGLRPAQRREMMGQMEGMMGKMRGMMSEMQGVMQGLEEPMKGGPPAGTPHSHEH